MIGLDEISNQSMDNHISKKEQRVSRKRTPFVY